MQTVWNIQLLYCILIISQGHSAWCRLAKWWLIAQGRGRRRNRHETTHAVCTRRNCQYFREFMWDISIHGTKRCSNAAVEGLSNWIISLVGDKTRTAAAVKCTSTHTCLIASNNYFEQIAFERPNFSAKQYNYSLFSLACYYWQGVKAMETNHVRRTQTNKMIYSSQDETLGLLYCL